MTAVIAILIIIALGLIARSVIVNAGRTVSMLEEVQRGLDE